MQPEDAAAAAEQFCFYDSYMVAHDDTVMLYVLCICAKLLLLFQDLMYYMIDCSMS